MMIGDEVVLDHKVGLEIRTLANLTKRHIGNLPTIKSIESVTGIHSWLIGYLYNHQDKDIYQKDIEELFSIRRSTATAILQRMEKNGLIMRVAVEHDARLKKIIITEKAAQIQKQIEVEISEFEKQIIRGISQEELEAFYKITEKMKANLE